MADDEIDDDDDEVIDEDEEGEGEDEESSGGSKKLLIIIGLAVLLLIGAAAAVFFTGLLDPLLGGGEETSDGADDEEDDGDTGPAVFHDIPEMIVTLNTGNRKPVFLKIRVSLELRSSEDVARIQSILPRIVDNFQVYLRELRIDDLKGSAGMYRLREELLTRVRAAAHPAKINAVLFKEMLIQ